MSYWLFIINDTDNEFKVRTRKKKWPLFQRTKNRTALREGDHVAFYKAGNDGQVFIGSAKIASRAMKSRGLLYSVDLTDIETWKKPVSIRDILESLEFITKPQIWGNYMQGGIRKINKDDFQLILSRR